jgi:hypothetical protein
MLVGDCVLPAWQHGREIVFPVLGHSRSPVKPAGQVESEIAEPSMV